MAKQKQPQKLHCREPPLPPTVSSRRLPRLVPWQIPRPTYGKVVRQTSFQVILGSERVDVVRRQRIVAAATARASVRFGSGQCELPVATSEYFPAVCESTLLCCPCAAPRRTALCRPPCGPLRRGGRRWTDGGSFGGAFFAIRLDGRSLPHRSS